MINETHRKRHETLNDNFQELLKDYLRSMGNDPTISDLIMWSRQQARPTQVTHRESVALAEDKRK